LVARTPCRRSPRRPIRWRLHILSAVLSALLVVSACTASPSNAIDRLQPCDSKQGPTDAYCGTLDVYENRSARTGRRIALNIVLLPAIGTDVRPDPLVFLAGGPGQGAAQMAGDVRAIFRRVLRRRDIVLVDQRGTGKSNPLDCRSESHTLRELTESDDAALERLRRCLAAYDADVRQYVTTVAMDDLDDVRAHLGYDRVNLYGGSYGTRAALVYLRQHGDRVRSMILDGVSPVDMRVPLFTARDAQRALDKLLGDCERDTTCRAAYPDLTKRIRALLLRLEATPPLVRVVHPRTGVGEEVRVEARVVASILFGALYNPITASLVPMLVERAEQNDFEPLFALGLAGGAASDNMSVGMQLSVLCSEDAARFTDEDIGRETAGSIFSSHLVSGQRRACALWPKADVDPSYYEPVTSDVPALVLSGDIDPVTPPDWGEAVTRHLRNARHIAVPATGHGVISTPCGARLIEEFLDRGSADRLDTSCVDTIRRPPFFVTPAGPEPAAVPSASERGTSPGERP
jgi:pimeloyl-ACP methyl ester carboxylesterase